MAEKTVEEMLREENIPDTDTTSAEAEAGQGQDPETAAEDKDTEENIAAEAASAEEADAEAEDAETDADVGAEDAGEDTDEASGEEKKGFFKRKKGDKEKKALKEKIDSLEDRVKRQMAEFDNFRKRTDKEKQQMFSMGERNVIEKMLPIVDNFERGLAAVPEEEKTSALASGMEMVYRQLVKQLEDLGVTPIEAVGQEFDPNLHNAVMQVESEEYPSGTVAQELQKGYKYHDAVIRYSMVAVVQ
jgi:molecular chaperone GrpE